MPNLIRNSIRTPDGTVLVSRHRHDYQDHIDANGKLYMVDGGFSYHRVNIHPDAPHEDLCVYDTVPHEVQREVIEWGTYGKKGDQPLEYVRVKDMEIEHIQAVLRECNPTSVIKNCMEKELEYRGA